MILRMNIFNLSLWLQILEYLWYVVIWLCSQLWIVENSTLFSLSVTFEWILSYISLKMSECTNSDTETCKVKWVWYYLKFSHKQKSTMQPYHCTGNTLCLQSHIINTHPIVCNTKLNTQQQTVAVCQVLAEIFWGRQLEYSQHAVDIEHAAGACKCLLSTVSDEQAMVHNNIIWSKQKKNKPWLKPFCMLYRSLSHCIFRTKWQLAW